MHSPADRIVSPSLLLSLDEPFDPFQIDLWWFLLKQVAVRVFQVRLDLWHGSLLGPVGVHLDEWVLGVLIILANDPFVLEEAELLTLAGTLSQHYSC